MKKDISHNNHVRKYVNKIVNRWASFQYSFYLQFCQWLLLLQSVNRLFNNMLPLSRLPNRYRVEVEMVYVLKQSVRMDGGMLRKPDQEAFVVGHQQIVMALP
jgi:hypothetical protein